MDLAKGYILHSTKKEKKLHNTRSKTEKYSQNHIYIEKGSVDRSQAMKS